MDALLLAGLVLIIITDIAGAKAEWMRRRAVLGSLKRHRYTTAERACAIVNVMIELAGAVLLWVNGYQIALVIFAFAVLNVILVIRGRDEDWFNRAGRKARRALTHAGPSRSV